MKAKLYPMNWFMKWWPIFNEAPYIKPVTYKVKIQKKQEETNWGRKFWVISIPGLIATFHIDKDLITFNGDRTANITCYVDKEPKSEVFDGAPAVSLLCTRAIQQGNKNVQLIINNDIEGMENW